MVNDTDETVYFPTSIVKVGIDGVERLSDYLAPGEALAGTGRDDTPPPPPQP